VARFQFEARDGAGAVVRGVEVAVDELDLDRQLREGGLLLVRASRLALRHGRGSSTRDLIDFCYHLAIVSEAGIPLLEGLRDLASGEHALRDTISAVARKIEAGSTLSAALDDHPDHFPELVRSLIRAGEESGALDRVLKDLVSYLEWRESLRRQISSAATYPVLVVVGIVGLLGLMIGWVLPRFLEIFEELGTELPVTTRALIWIHGVLADHWLALIIAAVVILVCSVALIRMNVVRTRIDAFVLRLPVIGSLVMMIETSRFAHNLSLMISTGVPMLRSLQMVEAVIQNQIIADTVRRTRERIEQGSTLTDALGQSDLMPSLVMRMISVGESSGHLEESLERIADFYDREIPVVVSRAIAVFNTASLLLLGATLVTIALSVFAPLYQMMGDLNA
jgi:type IV pilus assembly protein PilC